MDHCEELQAFVSDLKTSMQEVMASLSNIQCDDLNLKARIDGVETRCRKDIADITATVDGLKEELSTVAQTVRRLQHQQDEMNQQLVNWLQNPGACGQKAEARSKSVSVRRSRSADVILADHDSGIHSTNGGALTDPSSSPQSGQTSPTSNADSPTAKDDVVGQNRVLTTSLKRQLVPSYSSPLLSLELTSDKEREDDSDSETMLMTQKRVHHVQIQQQQAASGRSSTVVRRISRTSQSRHPKQSAPLSRADAAENDRFKLASEILNTEQAYCKRLWHMQANIFEPLKEANLVSQKDLNVLFPQELKLIYEQHCVFLHKLQTRLSSWEDEEEISVVSAFRPQFDARGYLACVYADYASSFSKITDTFKDNFLKNTDLIKFLKTRMVSRQAKNADVDLRLDDFLIMPLERVSYYVSVLKRLLQLAESENEKQQLSSVISNLEEVATEINGCIKRTLSMNNVQLSPDREDQSDSSNSRPIKKRYSKKQPPNMVESASAVLSRTDSAARRARSAAALARRQMQPQLLCFKQNDTTSSTASTANTPNVQLANSKHGGSMEVTRTYPRRHNGRQNRQCLDSGTSKKETQERFLTFGRGDASFEHVSPSSTGFASGIAEKALVRSSTSASVSALEKSKYEPCQSEPDLSQATSTSAEDSPSLLRTGDEAEGAKMPITIKEARRESSPSPMPVLKQRSRRYTTTNVVPIRYTHTGDFDTWHVNENVMTDQSNFRSTSLSPSRSVSVRAAPTDYYANEASNMRKVKHAKSGSSLKNSLAAFFSKRKNEQRFGATNVAGSTSSGRVPGGTSYSFWPGPYGDGGSEVGSVRSTAITLASNPNVRLLAGAIPRPQYSPSPRQDRSAGQAYGFDYRRDSFGSVQSGMARRRHDEGAFASNAPLYWWHKEKVPFEQRESSSEFVEV